MAFGIKSLRKKVDKETNKIKISVENLIVGEDFTSALLFCLLVKKHGVENVIWLKQTHENSIQIEKKWNHFSFLSINRLAVDEMSKGSFYKDQEFKLFTGKSKPQEMSEVEKLLMGNSQHVSWKNILEELEIEDEWNQFDSLIERSTKEAVVCSFSKGSQHDLVEKDMWTVETSKNDLILCQKLFWSDSLKKLKNISNRTLLNEEEMDYIELEAASEKLISSFVVHYKFQNAETLSIPEGNVFVPVRQSEEVGHFIGSVCESEASFFHHIQGVDEVNKEIVAKRLKKLKRNLERIFKTQAFSDAVENIYFSSELFSFNKMIDQKNTKKTIKNVHFFSSHTFSENILLDKINLLKNL